MKDTREVIENLKSQFAQQMQVLTHQLSQQASMFQDHRHFVEQVLKQQHEQMAVLTQMMMALSRHAGVQDDNKQKKGDIGPTDTTMHGSANE
jgi:hypothetical protein